MASRCRLHSVARGTALAFASRNNDVDGWWALGLLLEECPPGDPDYELDLLSGFAKPANLAGGLPGLGPAWARYLAWTLQRHKLPAAVVTSAVLSVRFDRDQTVGSWIPGNLDRTFTCSVAILDDRGRLREWLETGHCSRLVDFTDPNPWWRPRRSAGPRGDPGRVLGRIAGRSGPSDARMLQALDEPAR